MNGKRSYLLEIRLTPISNIKIPFTKGRKERCDAVLWYIILFDTHFANVGTSLEISFLHDLRRCAVNSEHSYWSKTF